VEIQDWQKEFVNAINNKFPEPWTKEQRLLAIVRQLADVSEQIQFNGTETNHRIAAIFPDLFMLCEQCGVGLDKELLGVLCWFHSKEVR